MQLSRLYIIVSINYDRSISSYLSRKTLEGFERIEQEGFTHSNHSAAQYKESDMGLIPWDWGGYNPDQKVDGLPVFLNIGEAKQWIAGLAPRHKYNGSNAVLPIIVHATLPFDYFKSQQWSKSSNRYMPSQGGLLELRRNDCNDSTVPAHIPTVLEYQQWTRDDRPKLEDPDGSIASRYYDMCGEHYISDYPIEEIRRRYQNDPTLQEHYPPDFTRYYTPRLYLTDGTIPQNNDIPLGQEQFGPCNYYTPLSTSVNFPLAELGLADLETILVD